MKNVPNHQPDIDLWLAEEKKNPGVSSPCETQSLPRRPEELVPGRFRFAIAQFEDAFQQLQDPLPPIFNQHLAKKKKNM